VLRVTADTNIFISGLIFRSGKPFQLLELARDGKISWQLKGPRGEETVELSVRIACDDFGFVRAAAVAGGGIGLMPRMIALTEVATGRLVRVLPEYGLSGAPLHVIYPSTRQVATKVSAFRDFLAKSCTQTLRD